MLWKQGMRTTHLVAAGLQNIRAESPIARRQ